MTLHEIATIWSDGTRFTAADLVRAYRSYEAECEEKGIDADDAETFFERDMEIPNVETTDDNTILAEANSEQRDRFDRAASAAGHASGTTAANDGNLWGKTVVEAIAAVSGETDADRTQQLYREAESRVRGDDRLAPHAATILDDHGEGDDHWRWVIDADADEIVSWAEAHR